MLAPNPLSTTWNTLVMLAHVKVDDIKLVNHFFRLHQRNECSIPGKTHHKNIATLSTSQEYRSSSAHQMLVTPRFQAQNVLHVVVVARQMKSVSLKGRLSVYTRT